MKRKATGDLGEQIARDYLKKHGHKIIETNFHCRYGEIDIVSRHKKVLVFTEVRTRTGTGYGTPEDSITQTKQSHMRSTAFHYVQTHTDIPETWRIDVIAIELNADGKIHRINLIENAVGDA